MISSNGLPSCPFFIRKGRMGCIDYSITSEEDCLSVILPYDGEPFWDRPATSYEKCLGHGIAAIQLEFLLFLSSFIVIL